MRFVIPTDLSTFSFAGLRGCQQTKKLQSGSGDEAAK
jgi:hypothetical protein